MAWDYLIQVGFLSILAILSVLVYRRFLIARRPTSATTPLSDPEVGNAKTYRIRGVPIEWQKDQLQSFLAGQDGCDDPIIKSLALEVHGRSKTGTATFQDGTKPPKRLRGNLQPSDVDQTLGIDDSFLGLTTLFAPSPEDHQVE